ncbi:3'(2'),5'-bisphosphate nucleotidase CysQ [Streptomyces badius]
MIDDFLYGTAGNTGPLAEVEAAVRAAAAAEIVPRHRKLAAHEIIEKSGPHDLVTAADRLAEEHLTAALTKLLPGSVVVGEESVHADPAVYDALGGDAPVWIVDPVDGTRQFVRGEAGFCTLVALAQHGEIHASWTSSNANWSASPPGSATWSSPAPSPDRPNSPRATPITSAAISPAEPSPASRP